MQDTHVLLDENLYSRTGFFLPHLNFCQSPNLCPFALSCSTKFNLILFFLRHTRKWNENYQKNRQWTNFYDRNGRNLQRPSSTPPYPTAYGLQPYLSSLFSYHTPVEEDPWSPWQWQSLHAFHYMWNTGVQVWTFLDYIHYFLLSCCSKLISMMFVAAKRHRRTFPHSLD